MTFDETMYLGEERPVYADLTAGAGTLSLSTVTASLRPVASQTPLSGLPAAQIVTNNAAKVTVAQEIPTGTGAGLVPVGEYVLAFTMTDSSGNIYIVEGGVSVIAG